MDTKFKKGQSGNPKGKNASKFGDLIRQHPKTPKLIQKLFDVALDDKHKSQLRAMSILMDRIAPQLKATEMKVDGDALKTGVIVLPEKRVSMVSRVGEKTSLTEPDKNTINGEA